jgi:hypothetical protein
VNDLTGQEIRERAGQPGIPFDHSLIGGSLGQPDPAQQVGEARVRMQTVKERIVLEKNIASGALLDTAIQPMESLVLVAQTRIDRRYNIAIDIFFLG